ncbi:uncharacterized protein LOC133786130 [Humulus lupulus]|uniref:uncharacterized protein LOC133786130 n=1 Tax=Humulus lupulus TaxID=3486 RepID=UPI002B4054A6|nr:uncharacterized protein LOC133786130 [Humulus lupulus]
MVFTDASGSIGLGGVLMPNGKVVAYLSRQYKTHEKNYPTHDLELAANRIQNGEQLDGWTVNAEEFVYHKGRIVVANIPDLRESVMIEAHRSKVKSEHQRPSRLLQPVPIPEWKKDCKVSELARLYVGNILRLHGLLSSIVSERDPQFISRFLRALHEALGTEFNLSTAHHPQKDGQFERAIRTMEDMLCSFEFEVGDYVFLKVAPMLGVTRFGVKGKLVLRYIGPFEVIERDGEVAYRLNLPARLGHVQIVFHLSMLRKYTPDPSHIIEYEAIPL